MAFTTENASENGRKGGLKSKRTKSKGLTHLREVLNGEHGEEAKEYFIKEFKKVRLTDEL